MSSDLNFSNIALNQIFAQTAPISNDNTLAPFSHPEGPDISKLLPSPTDLILSALVPTLIVPPAIVPPTKFVSLSSIPSPQRDHGEREKKSDLKHRFSPLKGYKRLDSLQKAIVIFHTAAGIAPVTIAHHYILKNNEDKQAIERKVNNFISDARRDKESFKERVDKALEGTKNTFSDIIINLVKLVNTELPQDFSDLKTLKEDAVKKTQDTVQQFLTKASSDRRKLWAANLHKKKREEKLPSGLK
jgi:hypothetical protein